MNLKYMKVSLFEKSYKKKNEPFHDILNFLDSEYPEYSQQILKHGTLFFFIWPSHKKV